MDLQDEERAASAHVHETRAPADQHLESESESEHCDKCRRKLTVVYIFNGKKLCENCVDREKDEWKEQGGDASGAPAIVKFRVKGNEGLLSRLAEKLSDSLADYIDRRRDSSKKGEVGKDSGKKGGDRKDGRGGDEGAGGSGGVAVLVKVKEKDEKEKSKSEVVTVAKPEKELPKDEERKGEFGKFFDSKKKERK
jgi:hypothetical protein